MATEEVAVLLMAYGGPDSLDDVAGYLHDVRGGRPTPAALVEEVRARYAAIGGRSPLLERTREQAAALGAALGNGWRVGVGMRHWTPRIADVLAELAAAGLGRVIALPMAPHYSDLATGAYRRACEAAPAAARGGVRLAFIGGWSEHPAFLAAVSERAEAALKRFPAAERTLVVFTAHSLPQRIVAAGDPYPEQLARSAAAVARQLGLESWRVAYQSAGRTDEPWLGPDAGDVIAEAAASGYRNVVIVPIGFVCDHVEVLYDVDIAFRRRAEGLGLIFARAASLNASPLLISALADLARGAARAEEWR